MKCVAIGGVPVPAFSVVLTTTYEVSADSPNQATLAALAVANGCKADASELGERRRIRGCIVKAKKSEVASIEERRTYEQIVAEFGVETDT